MHQVKLRECLSRIEKVYEMVREMERLGYTAKSNKYIV